MMIDIDPYIIIIQLFPFFIGFSLIIYVLYKIEKMWKEGFRIKKRYR